jgi:glyoxylase-like metal-dependent hydrolase (beta-lactamase superfamily II)
MQGTVTVTAAQRVKIHTYTAPERGWKANSHLLELPSQIIMLDAPLAVAFAEEVKVLAKSIDKPLTRIYVSHAHPDHFAGASHFDAPTYALASVKDLIDKSGNIRIERGYEYTPGHQGESFSSRGIDRVVAPGEEQIDGVCFSFESVLDAETTEQLAIGLPDLRILLAPDVLYNRVHMFIGEHAFDAWETAIGALEEKPYDTILPGHGLPGDREIYAASRRYLEVARLALEEASGPDDLNRRLEEAFPDYGGTAMQGLQNFYLFTAKS